MKCKEHPQYRGIRKPTAVNCATCWQIWAGNQKFRDDEELETLKYQAVYFKKIADGLKKQRNITNSIINEMKSVVSVMPKARPLIVPKPKRGNRNPQSLVLLLSDCQIGTEVIGKELGEEFSILNYTTDTFRYRLRLLLKGFLSIARREMEISKLHTCEVFVLGDLIENEVIFKPQMTFIDTNVMCQFFVAQYEVSRFLASLSRIFPKVRVVCLRGNHGRVGGSYKDHNELINWEYILYRGMERVLSKYDNIEFKIPLEWYSIEKVESRRILLLHGEDARRWLNFPWYGIDRMSKSYSEMLQSFNEPYDDLCFGHFHVPTNTETAKGEWFCNGTFVGATKFVMKRLHTRVRPSQTAFFVHPEMGITGRYKIHLDLEDSELLKQTQEDSYDIKTPLEEEVFKDLQPFEM